MSSEPEDAPMMSVEPESPEKQTKTTATKKVPATPRKRKSAKDEDGDDAAKTPSKRQVGVNSPFPKSRAEILPYDTLLLKLREQKISYPEILPKFVEAGGFSSTTNHLAKRMMALKALSVELDDAQKQTLVDIVAEIDAAFAKDKFIKVASEMMARCDGLEVTAASLKKTYEQIQKGGN